MRKAVVITGVNGGIGSATARNFLQADYVVFGTDIQPDTAVSLDAYWPIDLVELVGNPELQAEFKQALAGQLDKHQADFKAVVNNAAVQILGDVDTVTMDDFLLTHTVNVAAPLLISQLCLPHMERGQGVIVNIGSIHADSTKPGFISYASSKAAIKGLTQALAVDLAGRARVNCIEPGAIATNMLVAGFEANPDKLQELEACHPSGQLGTPEEVAELCHFLVDSNVTFLNGACIGLNGGITSRLHDPV